MQRIVLATLMVSVLSTKFESFDSPAPDSALLGRVLQHLDRMDKTSVNRALAKLDKSLTGKGTSTITNVTCESSTQYEPVLPGVLGGSTRPKIILAQDIDWPPYAFMGVPPLSNFDVAGIGHDVAKGLSQVCNIDVEVVQTTWGDCWSSGAIGTGLKDGHYHGCMTYTHTAGARPRMLEFTEAFLQDNKPAGILTRLDASGNPVVSPTSDLNGVNIVDVNGWAPTADTLAMVSNTCTGNLFSGYNMITPATTGNDAAMAMLMDGSADAMWVYADQAHNYDCTAAGVTPSWNCTLWTGLGTSFAYIHTGLFGHAVNGTTLAISKKGSGLSNIINPCLRQYMQTQDYYNVCSRNGLASSCYANSFFPTNNDATPTWETPTNQLTTTCANGYCPCSR